MVALRGEVDVLAPTLNETVPFPDPLVVLSVTHEADLLAVQAQPEFALTLKLLLPPPEAMFVELGLIEYVQEGVDWNVKVFEASLRPLPLGPTAATFETYVPPGSGHADTWLEKSNRILPSLCGAGFPMFTVWNGADAPC